MDYKTPCYGCKEKHGGCYEICGKHYWDGIDGCNNCVSGVRQCNL